MEGVSSPSRPHDRDVATKGTISVDVEADVRKFATQLKKDLDKALRGIKLDASSLGKPISDGIAKGVKDAEKTLDRLGASSSRVFDEIADSARNAGANGICAKKALCPAIWCDRGETTRIVDHDHRQEALFGRFA